MNEKEGKAWGGATFPSPPTGEKATDVGLDGRAQGGNLNGKDTREGEGGRNGRDLFFVDMDVFSAWRGWGPPPGAGK